MIRFVRVAAALLALVVLSSFGCRQRIDGNAYRGEAACAALDSLLAVAGLPRPLTAGGDMVIDVEQFRFRGKFQLELSGANELLLELGGSTLFGGYREDLAVSLVDDTLRVFDRERGRLYEGGELEEMIWGETKARADWPTVAARVFGSPVCRSVESLAIDEDGARGVEREGAFRLDVERGRVTRAVWPNPIERATFDDRLDIRYHWRGDGRLEEITASLPERGWRLRMMASK